MDSREPDSTASADTGAAWSSGRKLVISLLIAFHVVAVFAAPCASPPPSSYLANWFAGRVDGRPGLLLPYLQVMYLNHGYRFFGPNPGPSHLVRYEIELPGGGLIEGEFPNTQDHWPRLLYHRMFMISESLFNIENPVSDPPPEGTLPPEQMADFRHQRACADALIRSIARHLLDEHEGRRVRLYLRLHRLASPQEVLGGVPLDDPRFYQERPLGEFTGDDL